MPCERCRAELGQFSADGRTCAQCATGKRPSPSGDTCTRCPAGTAGINGICDKCDHGTVSAGGTPACDKCPASETSNSNHTACECKAGFYDSATVGTITCMTMDFHAYIARTMIAHEKTEFKNTATTCMSCENLKCIDCRAAGPQFKVKAAWGMPLHHLARFHGTALADAKYTGTPTATCSLVYRMVGGTAGVVHLYTIVLCELT